MKSTAVFRCRSVWICVSCSALALMLAARSSAQGPHFASSLLEASDRRLDLSGGEPFGAEDGGMEDNAPSIPEPLFFDLVRGLGAHRGEFEMNVLGMFPLNRTGPGGPQDFDPFGLFPGSQDEGGVEWAPEIEYAVMDGLAFEFELPFEDGQLEAYKFASQYTFGTAFENRFIHGTQAIVEPDIHFDVWDVTLLYLAGIQFNRTWSALGMIGARPQIEESAGVTHTDGILNVSVFADVAEDLTLGLETNLTFGERERTTFLLLPQLDYELTDELQLQAGLGVGFSVNGTQALLGVRAIYSR
jgi:hypothetical protein